MQLATLQAGVASLIILAPGAESFTLHRNVHHLDHVRRHTHLHHQGRAIESPPSSPSLVKRGTCQFPTDDPNLVAITPDQVNAGWAMSPDQSCRIDSYCPFACKPGMVMNQWEKGSTYTYPSSMNGGLYCDKDGNVQQPFPGQPNCIPGTGSVQVLNTCSKKVSFCQTTLPGNENMLIPTVVDTSSVLAVPGFSYWEHTAAHFYINSPGIGSEGCKWGTASQAVGNWATLVAGANTDANGQTFVKLGINPVWESSGLFSTKPTFGARIDCPDGGCYGLPCEYKPGGILNTNDGASGAGGASFCVVTVDKGKTANIVIYDGSGGHSPVANANAAQPSSSASPSPSSSSSTTTTHSSTPSPSSTSTSTSTSTTSTSSSSSSSSPTSSSSSTSTPSPTPRPGIFHEDNNSTSTMTTQSTSAQSSTSSSASPTTKDKKNDGGRQQGSTAIAGLVVALVVAACFY